MFLVFLQQIDTFLFKFKLFYKIKNDRHRLVQNSIGFHGTKPMFSNLKPKLTKKKIENSVYCITLLVQCSKQVLSYSREGVGMSLCTDWNLSPTLIAQSTSCCYFPIILTVIGLLLYFRFQNNLSGKLWTLLDTESTLHQASYCNTCNDDIMLI